MWANGITHLNPTTQVQMADYVTSHTCSKDGCDVILLYHESGQDDADLCFRADSCQLKHDYWTLCCSRHKATHQCIECLAADEEEIAQLEALVAEKRQKIKK